MACEAYSLHYQFCKAMSCGSVTLLAKIRWQVGLKNFWSLRYNVVSLHVWDNLIGYFCQNFAGQSEPSRARIPTPFQKIPKWNKLHYVSGSIPTIAGQAHNITIQFLHVVKVCIPNPNNDDWQGQGGGIDNCLKQKPSEWQPDIYTQI